MDSRPWYDSLDKPSWTPSPQVIGVIWSILYPIIVAVNGYVLYKVIKGELPRQLLLPFALNLVFNLIFTPIQFGLKNLPLASLDIILVLGTILWCMAAIYRHVPWATYAFIPYLVWVAIATVLQLSITAMNRH